MLNLFSVYDSVSNTWSNPFTEANSHSAIRAFSAVVNNSDTSISQHPSDYFLYNLGSFDPTTGVITSAPTPFRLAAAVEFVKRDKEEPVVNVKTFNGL